MPSFEPKNILVTGAAGFIGSNFVRFVLQELNDIRVISFDKLTYSGNLDNLQDAMLYSNHIFIKGDICHEDFLYDTIRDNNIDTIVHFAAESHVDNSIASPKVFIETNILGTYNLLQQAKTYWLDEQGWDESKCRFYHISTDEVYGSLEKDDPAFTETKAYEPNSPYSASKAGSDHIVRAFHHTYKLPVVTSNCSNNYGSYQHIEKFIPVIIKSCVEQKPIPIYGDGLNIRDWLYVEDHCDAIWLVLTNGVLGEVYNIGGNNEIDNITLVRNICKIMDDLKPEGAPHDRLISFVEDRKGHDYRYSVDSGKIRKDLRWQKSTDFYAGLRITVEFYLKCFSEIVVSKLDSLILKA